MAQKPFVRLPGTSRAGITTSKKSGGAIARSRCRRVIRAAYRELLPRISPGWDIVFVARAATSGVKSTVLRRVMERQLTALGVLRREDSR